MLNVTSWDWHRILLGDTQWSFMIEVLLRGAIVYMLLLFMMRLIGRRVAAQLSISELAVMLTLGAAIGVPLQTPEKGILPAAVLLLTALLFQRGLSCFSFKSRSVEIAHALVVEVVRRPGNGTTGTLQTAALLERGSGFTVCLKDG
ncbi:hypothetical protein ACI2KR_26025 [Pseudomonas luteola]